MPNDHKSRVLTVLQFHIGRGYGISVKQLAQQTGLPPRTLRTRISELRDDGVAICGTPRDGYYVAKTAEELEDTCTFLHNRALHSLGLEAKLRRIPLTDLLGQLHLPT